LLLLAKGKVYKYSGTRDIEALKKFVLGDYAKGESLDLPSAEKPSGFNTNSIFMFVRKHPIIVSIILVCLVFGGLVVCLSYLGDPVPPAQPAAGAKSAQPQASAIPPAGAEIPAATAKKVTPAEVQATDSKKIQ
jgi:hypothetical protein